jgi:hypothetical protein
MSTKRKLSPYQIITSGDMSQASITSTPTNIQYLDNVGIQLTWTGAPVGTFSIQISSDYQRDAQGNVTNAGNWVTLPLSPAITASGSADTAYIDMTQLSAPWVRVLYTKTSGTGTLQGYVTGKTV